VEKKRKKMKEKALIFERAVDAEANRIKGLLEPIETHLEAQETAIDQEKARIKAEAEKREQERIQARINRLFEMGCRFDGQKFSLPFAPDGFFLPQALAKTAADEQFEVFCQEFQKPIDAENERLAEADRQRKADEDALKERQRVFDIKEKIQALSNIGTTLEMTAVQIEEAIEKYDNLPITKEAYQEFVEEAFQIHTQNATSLRKLHADVVDRENKAARLKSEQDRIDKEKRDADEKRWRLRLGLLKDAGWNGQEAFDKETKNQIISYEDLIGISDEAFEVTQKAWDKTIADREKKRQDEAKKKEAEEKAAAEAEAKKFEEMKPDKEKLLKLADALDSFELPVLKHKKPIVILTDVKTMLSDTSRYIRESVGQLKPRKTK
jgi:hypothetical protein